MNKLTIIGNLTRDPETRATPSGVTVCSFTVAVNRRFAPAGEEKVTDFFRVNTFRGMAESCGKYLTKGRKVAVVGELQARSYEDKEGKTRFSLDIAADEVEFLSERTAEQKPAEKKPVAKKSKTDGSIDSWEDISQDELPF